MAMKVIIFCLNYNDEGVSDRSLNSESVTSEDSLPLAVIGSFVARWVGRMDASGTVTLSSASTEMSISLSSTSLPACDTGNNEACSLGDADLCLFSSSRFCLRHFARLFLNQT